MEEPNNKYQIPIMLGLAAFTTILSIPEIPLPPGPRQAELLYKGWAVLEGQLPYKDFWDNGSPGILYIYALALKLFGHRYESINILDIIWRCGTTIAIYLLVKRRYRRLEGIIAGILCAIISSTIGATFELNALPEGFAILPIVLGFYFYHDNKIGSSVLSGIFMALASVLKLPLFLLVIIISLFAILSPRDTWEPRPRRSKMFSFLYGVVIVFSMLIFYFLLSWTIVNFYNQVLIYNLHDAESIGNWSSSSATMFCILLPLLALIILVSRGLGLLADTVLEKTVSLSRRLLGIILSIILIYVLIVIGPSAFYASNDKRKDALEYLSGQIDKKVYFSRFKDPLLLINNEIASYLEKHTKSEDMVIGSPLLNFLSKRVDPGGFEPIWNQLADQNSKTQIIIKDYYNNWKKRSIVAHDGYMVIYSNQIKNMPAERKAKYMSIQDCSTCNCGCATQFIFSDGSIVCHYCRE